MAESKIRIGQVNSLETQLGTIYTQANNAYTQANAAYDAANNAQVTVYQNSASSVTTQTVNFVNTATITVSVSNDNGNANIALTAVGGAAFDQANAAREQANTARSDANTTFATINTTFGTVNTEISTANTQANSGRDQANNAYAQANAARDQANSAYTQANAAYLAANNANLLLGGVITGTLNVTQDIIVGGNVYLEGNTTFINVTTYSIEDSLIYLASNNQLTDSVDIGFMGGKNTSGTYAHTGLARDATDGKWKLFDGLPEEGHVGNVINFNNSYLATLVANVEANTLSVVNGVSGNVDFDNGTLFVDSVGNRIGIGTTIPAAKLSVYDNNQFTVTPNYTAYQTIPSGVLVATKNAANLSFVAASTGGEAGNGINIIAYSGSQWHRGLTYNNKSGVPDLLLQQDGGNVGIGSTTPTANLDVVGTANVSSNTIILGSVGVGGAISSRTKLDISGTMTSSANTTLGILNRGTIPAAANSTATMFQSQPSTEAATFTLDTLNHYFANTTTLGTNSVLTTQHGFIVGSSFTQAANNIGFRSDIPENGLSHFGANNWNLYVGGTANNFIQGNLFFSSLISSGIAAEGKIFIGGILPRFSGDRGLGFRLRANIANTAFGESIGFWSAIGAETTTFGTRLGITHFRATQVGTLPDSPSSRIYEQHGFYVDTTLVSALNLNIAFRGRIPDTGGTAPGYSNTWNFYADGTASNYFRGKTGIGTRNPQANLDIFRSNTINTTTPGTTTYALHLTPENATVDTATGITFGAGDSSSGQTAQAGIYSQFSGSYGTKLYFATTDSYATGARTRMMIDHAGNVGIGTNTPTTPLHVNGGPAGTSGWNRTATLQATFPALIFNSNATKWAGIAYDNTAAMRFWVNASSNDVFATSPVVSILNNGNVGIGTGNPGSILQVRGAGSSNNYRGVIRIDNTDTTNAWGGISFPDNASGSDTNANNYYFIGRGGAISSRIFSIHMPTAGDYGSGSQPIFGVYSTGSDRLFSVTASTGDSYFKGSMSIDGAINFLRGDSSYTTFIRAQNHPDQGYTGSTQKYWIELGSYGGTHVTLNMDGVAGSAENTFDHFTIWQAAANSTSGSRQFYVTNVGTVWARGTITGSSDERLKKDWSSLPEGFTEKLSQIKSGTFTRIDIESRQAGISAQSIREILPEVVREDSDGMLSVAYGNAAMVSAVELAKEVVELKKQIAELYKIIREMK